MFMSWLASEFSYSITKLNGRFSSVSKFTMPSVPSTFYWLSRDEWFKSECVSNPTFWLKFYMQWFVISTLWTWLLWPLENSHFLLRTMYCTLTCPCWLESSSLVSLISRFIKTSSPCGNYATVLLHLQLVVASFACLSSQIILFLWNMSMDTIVLVYWKCFCQVCVICESQSLVFSILFLPQFVR